jgi:hypothetical protein
LYWSTRTQLAAPADGKLIIRNAGDTAGILLDATTDNRLSLASRTGPGTAAAALGVYPQTITCADSGDGNHSTCGGAQTISSNVVQLVCSDTDGCTLTLAETNWSATSAGDVTLHGPAANHVDVADSAGVLELGAAGAMAMDAADTLSISYSPLLYWAETSRSAN